jgi:hypothetical protein
MKNGASVTTAVARAPTAARVRAFGAAAISTPRAAATPISSRNSTARPASTPAAAARRGASDNAAKASSSAGGFGPGPLGQAIAPATPSHAASAHGREAPLRRTSP